MYRSFYVILILFLLVVFLAGCGDVEPITEPPPPEVAEISSVLKDRWPHRGPKTFQICLNSH